MPEIRIGGVDELDRLAQRLRDAGRGDLQDRLRDGLRAAAGPTEAKLRTAARGADVTSSRGGRARPDTSTGLRARVSRAVDVRATDTGIRYVVDAAKVDPRYGVTLPKYLDGELRRYRRWRHPVFGDREVWTSQTGSPWFFATIRGDRRRFENAIRRAMDAIARHIQG